MLLCVENPIDHTHAQTHSGANEGAQRRYRIQDAKSIVLLYISNEPDNEIYNETIPVTIASKRIQSVNKGYTRLAHWKLQIIVGTN